MTLRHAQKCICVSCNGQNNWKSLSEMYYKKNPAGVL